MSDIRATVLIPTHEHGELLRLAARSALGQTVQDIELFIVLDGPDQVTMAVAEEVAARDDRVRLFPHEKGERHGEAHRHAALGEARGRIVCYLSDDDLWAPDHIEYLDRLLQQADFAHSLAVVLPAEGEPTLRFVGDLGDGWYRDRMRSGKNFIPFSAAGHTLEAYRALPVGWSPAPTSLPTDLHMWLKFLAVPDLRLVSGGRATLLHVPTSERRETDHASRLVELESWSGRLEEPGAWQELRSNVFEALPARLATAVREGLEAAARLERARAEQERAEERSAELGRSLAEALAQIRDLEAALQAGRDHLAGLERDLEAAHHHAEGLEQEIAAIRGSVAYRASRRLARMPVIGRVARWVGVALARRGGR